MWLTASILSAFFFALASFIITIGAKKNYYITQLLLGLYISGGLIFACYLAFNNRFDFSYQILFWGVIIGLGSSLGNALFTYALRLGPVSLTAPLANTNVILVVAMSVLYYGEVLTITQTVAILMLLAACFILPFDPDESKKVNNKNWFIVMFFTVIFLFLLNGGLKITQELNLDNTVVLFYSYVFSTIVFFISIKFIAIKSPASFLWEKKAISIGLFAGIFSFLGLQMYSYALQIGPASIVVPIFSSRNVLVAMMCILYFKEKLSRFQVVALTSLLAGLCLVNF